VAVAALAAGLWLVPIDAADARPSGDEGPMTVPQGDPFELEGAGCQGIDRRATVGIRDAHGAAAGETEEPAIPDGDGNWSAVAIVSPYASRGMAEVTASCQAWDAAHGVWVTVATFPSTIEIVLASFVSVSAQRGDDGRSFTGRGNSCVSEDDERGRVELELSLDEKIVALGATVANADGVWTRTFTLPAALTPDVYEIDARCFDRSTGDEIYDVPIDVEFFGSDGVFLGSGFVDQGGQFGVAGGDCAEPGAQVTVTGKDAGGHLTLASVDAALPDDSGGWNVTVAASALAAPGIAKLTIDCSVWNPTRGGWDDVRTWRTTVAVRRHVTFAAEIEASGPATFVVRGRGCVDAGSVKGRVFFYLDGERRLPGSAHAGSDDTWSYTFTLPAHVVGDYTVIARCAIGNEWDLDAEIELEVSVEPGQTSTDVTVDVAEVEQGGSVRVSGHGCTAIGDEEVWLDAWGEDAKAELALFIDEDQSELQADGDWTAVLHVDDFAALGTATMRISCLGTTGTLPDVGYDSGRRLERFPRRAVPAGVEPGVVTDWVGTVGITLTPRVLTSIGTSYYVSPYGDPVGPFARGNHCDDGAGTPGLVTFAVDGTPTGQNVPADAVGFWSTGVAWPAGIVDGDHVLTTTCTASAATVYEVTTTVFHDDGLVETCDVVGRAQDDCGGEVNIGLPPSGWPVDSWLTTGATLLLAGLAVSAASCRPRRKAVSTPH
jgi:hypothetical protein